MHVGIRLRDWLLATSSHQRPTQIAWAVTCGVLLGLLPKATGLFVLAVALCLCLPIHLPMLAIAACVVSWTLPIAAMPLGRVGLWTLTESPLAAWLTRIDGLPLIPWIGLHNSVACGVGLSWLAISLPLYLISLTSAKILLADIAVADRTASVEEFLVDRSLAAGTAKYQTLRELHGERVPGPSALAVEPPTVILHPLADDFERESLIEFQLDEPSYLQQTSYLEGLTDDLNRPSEILTTDQILQRAVKLADWAEEAIGAVLQSEIDSNITGEATTAPDSLTREAQVLHDGAARVSSVEDQWLIETTMEVVRIAEQAVSQQAALKSKLNNDTEEEPIETLLRTDSPQNQETSTMNLNHDAVLEATAGSHLKPNVASGPGLESAALDLQSNPGDGIRRQQAAHGNQPRDEALRYLLRHLKGIQDKVHRQ